MNSYENKNLYRLFFNNFPNYEDMESLFEKFENELNAMVIDKIDGPYSRTWKIIIADSEYTLIIDEDYGSSIVADKEISINNLKELSSLIAKFIS
jgi:C4-type Zn-finger protein